jgi:hypothetical protein
MSSLELSKNSLYTENVGLDRHCEDVRRLRMGDTGKGNLDRTLITSHVGMAPYGSCHGALFEMETLRDVT